MKKTVSKILAILIVIVVCVLCSCTSKENKLRDLDEEAKEPKNFILKTENTEYSCNEKTISYSITNVSVEEIGVGTEFELQFKTDYGWKVVAFNKDMAFEGFAWILNPGERKTFQLKLEQCYNLPLKPGEYRIAHDGYISNAFIIN